MDEINQRDVQEAKQPKSSQIQNERIPQNDVTSAE